MLVVGCASVAFSSAVWDVAGGVASVVVSAAGTGFTDGVERVTTRNVDSGAFAGETADEVPAETVGAVSCACFSASKSVSGVFLTSRTLVALVTGWERAGAAGSVVGTEEDKTLGRMVPGGNLRSFGAGGGVLAVEARLGLYCSRTR
jgi:hypothetical protein